MKTKSKALTAKDIEEAATAIQSTFGYPDTVRITLPEGMSQEQFIIEMNKPYKSKTWEEIEQDRIAERARLLEAILKLEDTVSQMKGSYELTNSHYSGHWVVVKNKHGDKRWDSEGKYGYEECHSMKEAIDNVLANIENNKYKEALDE